MFRQQALERRDERVTLRTWRLVSYIQRRPVAALLSWFFTVGQAIVFVPVVLQHNGVSVSTEPFIVVASWVGLLLPALTVVKLSEGRAGLRRLLGDATRVGVPGRWYLMALVTVPLGVLALQWAAEGAPGATDGAWSEAVAVGLVLNTVVVFVTVNWAEEVVWTGVVQGTLQRRGWSPLRAATAVAPLFALGHISLVVDGDVASGLGLLAFIVVLSVPFRALQGWLYNRTRSLVLPGLLHATGNAAALGSLAGLGMIPRLYGTDGQSVLIFAGLGMLVIGLTRGRLGGPSKKSHEGR
jgi:uncharacterized protein